MVERQLAATTRVDSQGEMFLKEALESQSKHLEKTPVRQLYEHDWSIPPAAKGVRGEIEELEDGAFGLFMVHEPFVSRGEVRLPNGERGLVSGALGDRRPFESRYSEISSTLQLAIDHNNFEDAETLRAFEAEPRTLCPYEVHRHGRKAELPDPEAVVVLTRFVVENWWMIPGYLGANRVVGKIADKVGEKLGEEVASDVVAAYRWAKQVPVSLLTWARPRGREATCIYVIPGVPEIQFVVQSRLQKTFLRAVKFELFNDQLSKADELHRTFDATEIQFLWDKHDGWVFNFLLTKNGDVIGTPVAMSRRSKRMQLDASRFESRR